MFFIPQHFRLISLYYILIITFSIYLCTPEVCYKNNENCNQENVRYLFYDVNLPEGFNLRRDVYMRFAVLAYNLKRMSDTNLNSFRLVLPPWSHLMHWKYSYVAEYLPWSALFDLKSLQKFAPVIEMYEYFNSLDRKYSKTLIDEVYILQHFKDMFETGNFEDRMNVEECQNSHEPSFFYYGNITSRNIKCLSYHGPATKLTELLKTTKAKTILLDHAEVALHSTFDSKIYWKARRSMRFNKELREIAAEFRRTLLNSTDDADNTLLPDDWQEEMPRRNAQGGAYLAVHLRRRDFVRGRPDDTPTLESVAKQIVNHLKRLKLKNVFIASDAPQTEFEELTRKIPKEFQVFRYVPTDDVQKKFTDGGAAIIDQIICSYARYFIGTHESTFSFRIQEEREILGFPLDTTFNCLCKDDRNCKKPSVWKIVY